MAAGKPAAAASRTSFDVRTFLGDAAGGSNTAAGVAAAADTLVSAFQAVAQRGASVIASASNSASAGVGPEHAEEAGSGASGAAPSSAGAVGAAASAAGVFCSV